MSRVGQTIGDRFELEAELGEGGMAVVWRATDGSDGARVALKLLHRVGELTQMRFDREARLLAGLDLPGVVRYVAHGVHDGRPWLAMEWLEGRDLEAELARRRLTLDEAVALGRRVAITLAEAHERGVVHRDIKPSNLFLPGGVVDAVKVVDFGIAADVAAEVALTRPGSIVGTPSYMAPEQARGAADVDARADLFSLGCVLYECITGVRAFDGGNAMAILTKVIFEPSPSTRALRDDVPEPLDALVGRLLEKEPSDRPASAREVAVSLARFEGVHEGVTLSANVRLPIAMTEREQRWVSLVLTPPVPPEHAARLEAELSGGALEDDGVDGDGGRVARLRDGSVAVLVTGGSAERAARIALSMRAALGAVPLAVASGRAVLGGELPVGDVIERAVAVLAGTPPGAVRIDASTAARVEGRFALQRDGDAIFLRRAAPPARPRAAWVGRRRELSELEAGFAACRADARPCGVLVSGPAGIGKSRLVDELARRVEASAVIRGAATRAGRERAHYVLAQLVAHGLDEADHAKEPGSSQPGSSQPGSSQPGSSQPGSSQPGSSEPGSSHSALRSLLGEPVAAAFLAEVLGASVAPALPEVRTARADPPLMEARVRDAVLRWLGVWSRRGPTLIVVDDAQWMDAASARALGGALAWLEGAVMVVLTGRPEAAERLAREWPAPLREMPLGPLDADASAALLRARMGSADEAIVTGFVRAASGNPLVLEQLARTPVALVESGGARDSVLWAVESRLMTVSAGARRVLRAASVLGATFQRAALLPLLGGSSEADAVDAHLEELLREELIVPSAHGGRGAGALVFRHDLVREAAYAMLTDEDRVLAHGAAAQWLGQRPDADPLVLAEHLERAGKPHRAVPYLIGAAQRALEGNAMDAARRLAARAVDAGAQGEERGAVELVWAQAWRWSSGHEEAARHARHALDALPEGSPAWFSGIEVLAASAGPGGNADELRAWAARLRARPPGMDERAGWAGAASALGKQLTGAGDYDLADALLDEAERWVELAGDETLRAAHLHAAAFRAVHGGALDEAVEAYRHAAEIMERTGDVRSACMVRGSLGYVETELGLLERAEETLVRALALADSLHLESARLSLLHNLGHARTTLGRPDEAVRDERDAAEGLRRIGHVRLAGGSHIYLAEALAALGRFGEALEALDTAAQLLGAFPPMLPLVRANRARVLLRDARTRGGDASAALGEAEAAMRALAELGGTEQGDTLVRLVLCEALAANGRAEDARRVVDALRESVMRRAEALRDPALRESFLHRHPDNARVLQLAGD